MRVRRPALCNRFAASGLLFNSVGLDAGSVSAAGRRVVLRRFQCWICLGRASILDRSFPGASSTSSVTPLIVPTVSNFGLGANLSSAFAAE